MSFLLDTDTCSAFLKANPLVWQRCMQYAGQLHVSVVSVGELYTWALRKSAPPKRLNILEDFLRDVIELEVSGDVARKFGELRAALLDAGQPPPVMDLLIAATAAVNNLVVVTHNVKDFSSVPGLTVMDWLIP